VREAFDDKSMKGREKIFEVRRVYNDVNFIDEFLTEEFCEKHRMFEHKRDPETGELKVVSRDFKRVKQTLLHYLTNMGQPFLYVVDGNYLNRGELYLAHRFTGLEVDLAKASEVLGQLRFLWGRPVHLQTVVNEDMSLFSVTEVGGKPKRERITADMPKPGNVL
jgi:stage V sporulation protein R